MKSIGGFIPFLYLLVEIGLTPSTTLNSLRVILGCAHLETVPKGMFWQLEIHISSATFPKCPFCWGPEMKVELPKLLNLLIAKWSLDRQLH